MTNDEGMVLSCFFVQVNYGRIAFMWAASGS